MSHRDRLENLPGMGLTILASVRAVERKERLLRVGRKAGEPIELIKGLGEGPQGYSKKLLFLGVLLCLLLLLFGGEILNGFFATLFWLFS